jgi:hypothetical protein
MELNENKTEMKIIHVIELSEDWVVHLITPNLRRINILIPKSEYALDEKNPYGLNLVCRGHYL